MMDAFDRGIANPIKPRIVETGPCKENVITGDDVNLTYFRLLCSTMVMEADISVPGILSQLRIPTLAGKTAVCIAKWFTLSP